MLSGCYFLVVSLDADSYSKIKSYKPFGKESIPKILSEVELAIKDATVTIEELNCRNLTLFRNYYYGLHIDNISQDTLSDIQNKVVSCLLDCAIYGDKNITFTEEADCAKSILNHYGSKDSDNRWVYVIENQYSREHIKKMPSKSIVISTDLELVLALVKDLMNPVHRKALDYHP